MASKFPMEVDVFAVPHSRMKDLVGKYTDQLSTADFCSNGALEALLPKLQKTFIEFNIHEDIENRFIMDCLKQRLKLLNLSSKAICSCHRDSRLNGILKLLNEGYTCTSRTVSERVDFGFQLQKAVFEFTEKFIPHMEEEEEVFQPLLMKYFEYDELKKLKALVIEQHELWKKKLQVEKANAENMLTILSSLASGVADYYTPDDDPEEFQEALQKVVDFTCHSLVQEKKTRKPTATDFNHLPGEMITSIFSYLNVLDRTRCARVCKLWNVVVFSPLLWKEIYPTNWAKGFYDFGYQDPYNFVELEWSKLTYDDDYDDSESGPSPEAEKEIQFYEDFVRYGLPRIGDGVQKLVVAGGLNLSSQTFRSMLILCPNIQHLDASYTSITDISFKGLAKFEGCSALEHLDLSACRFVTDVGLERLGSCFKLAALESKLCSGGGGGGGCSKCGQVEFDDDVVDSRRFSRGLFFLNLSGCTAVTDYGLKYLLDVTLRMDSLKFMDLSGCSKISAPTLNSIAALSSRLKPQDLYYCNRIEEGPYPTEANGCQNLECPIRACCCFDQ